MRMSRVRNIDYESTSKDYETYYRGEEEPFYYKSYYYASQYLLIFNILILDYNKACPIKNVHFRLIEP